MPAGLLEANGVGKNVNLNIRVVEAKRQFCNKIWQARCVGLVSRYVVFCFVSPVGGL